MERVVRGDTWEELSVGASGSLKTSRVEGKPGVEGVGRQLLILRTANGKKMVRTQEQQPYGGEGEDLPSQLCRIKMEIVRSHSILPSFYMNNHCGWRDLSSPQKER